MHKSQIKYWTWYHTATTDMLYSLSDVVCMHDKYKRSKYSGARVPTFYTNVLILKLLRISIVVR